MSNETSVKFSKKKKKKVAENSVVKFFSEESPNLKNLASTQPSFYSVHQNRFFDKSRWLFAELAELQWGNILSASECTQISDEVDQNDD